jgi:hypothetical protein
VVKHGISYFFGLCSFPSMRLFWWEFWVAGLGVLVDDLCLFATAADPTKDG